MGNFLKRNDESQTLSLKSNKPQSLSDEQLNNRVDIQNIPLVYSQNISYTHDIEEIEVEDKPKKPEKYREKPQIPDYNEVVLKRIKTEDPLEQISMTRSLYPSLAPLIRFRTSFSLGEIVEESQSDNMIHAFYGYPFSQETLNTLAIDICALLNRKGGRIYIGIPNDNRIKGIELSLNDKLALTQNLFQRVSDFEPPVSQDIIRVCFIPIKDTNHKFIPNLYIVKIIVKQGDPTKLYSIHKNSMTCYIRADSTSNQLMAKDITNEIIRRNMNPSLHVSQQEFEDPEPDVVI